MYNGFIATNTRLKKNKTAKDSPSTAGMAKAPSGGLKGREELKNLGEQYGWSVRELSLREIRQMSADETLWHEVFNRENFDSAFTRAENQRTNKERMEVWDKRRMWGGGATPEETEKARAAGDEFATRFPAFARTVENAQAMVRFLEENDLDGTQLSSYVTAFRALTEQGKLKLAPAQSANEYLAQHLELKDNRVPPLIAARNAKAEQTAKHFEAAANATAKGTIVSFMDYPSEQSGYPAAPTKYSFRKLLDSLSAEEYQKRLNQDAAFAAAVDKLQNGNK